MQSSSMQLLCLHHQRAGAATTLPPFFIPRNVIDTHAERGAGKTCHQASTPPSPSSTPPPLTTPAEKRSTSGGLVFGGSCMFTIRMDACAAPQHTSSHNHDRRMARAVHVAPAPSPSPLAGMWARDAQQSSVNVYSLGRNLALTR